MLRLPERPHMPQIGASPEVRRFLVRMLPGLLAAAIPQLALIAGTIVASSSPAGVSWLTYAYRLYELPLGLVSVAIAAVMTPAIAARVRADDRAATATVQSRAFELALGLALPASVGLMLLAEPIVGGLFERGAFGARDTTAVAGALAAISFGIVGHASEKILASVSFAHEDTRTPMLTALAGLATSATAAVIVFPRLGHVGVALAVASCGWMSAALLGIALARRHWLHVDSDFRRRMPRILLATAVMGAVIAGLQAALPGVGNSQVLRLASMTLAVAVGVGVYLAALHLLGVVRFSELRAASRRPR
jgi:putative peptidoglycan lipid II flippase